MCRFCFPAVMVLVACSASSPRPSVRAVEPSVAFAQADVTVVLSGSFSPRVKVDFEQLDASVRDAQFTVRAVRDDEAVQLERVSFVDTSTLTAVVPRGLGAGVWSILVRDPWGSEARLVDGLTVLDCAAVLCTLSDGGIVDAGVRDAGVDGGTDAGVVDAGPVDAGPQPCGTMTFADDDQDGYGKPGTEAMLCGIDRSTRGGDCDDVDPDTHENGTERCNLVDDDCDGNIDEGVCPVLNPNWIRRLESPTSRQWATVSAFGVGRVWLAGEADVMLRSDGGFLEPVSTNCPTGLSRSFTSGPVAIFGGGVSGGSLATHVVGASGCGTSRTTSDVVVGLFEEPDAGVSVSGVLRNGRRFTWIASGQPVEQPVSFAGELFEAARGSDGSLFAVGTQSGSMRVWQWLDGGWADENVTALNLPLGRFLAVSVRSSTSVFAAGDTGIVIEKVGTAWRRLPTAVAGNVTSVTAFNPARVYATSSAGSVLKWNGRQWRALYVTDAGVSFNDLSGATESDLWAVGTRGFVLHWAE